MADNLKDLFINLKSNILGTRSAKIDSEIDQSLQSIEKFSSKISHNKYIESLKNLAGSIGSNTSTSLGLLKDFNTTNNIEIFDQTGRISRYREYEAILKKISYCRRALEVLTDNIISPDDITKNSILFVNESQYAQTKDSKKEVISRLHQIEKHIQLDKHIKKIVSKTLKKGDNFIEILYSPKGENAFSILNENEIKVNYDKINKIGEFSISINATNKADKSSNDEVTLNKRIIIETVDKVENITSNREVVSEQGEGMIQGTPVMAPYFGGSPTVSGAAFASGGNIATYSAMNMEPISKDSHPAGGTPTIDTFKSKFDKPETKVEDKQLRDIFISIHDPRFVIRLETERFKTCLGFLVFPKIDLASAAMGTYSMGKSAIDAMCLDFLNKLKVSLQGNIPDDISINQDVKDILVAYITAIRSGDDLKIRYVPPQMMVHWRINVDQYYPYGESIFDVVSFDCKLLMALKVANTIKKLTSATDKRIISVETGLPRDAKNLIEMMKEGMRKRKICVDSFGSIDSIPSNIATFEDIYIPMRDGKKFVEFDQQQWGPNPQDDIESLKFMRDGIIGDLGVPPAFVGMEEGAGNRNLLTVENIMFCRTIISYQKELSVFIRELFFKIYQLLYLSAQVDLDSIKMTFPEPKASPYEHEMEYVEQMQRLIDALKQLGIPEGYLKKKYLPQINWEEIEAYKAEDTLKTELGNEPPQDNNLGGGNSLSMGGMGMSGSYPNF